MNVHTVQHHQQISIGRSVVNKTAAKSCLHINKHLEILQGLHAPLDNGIGCVIPTDILVAVRCTGTSELDDLAILITIINIIDS